MAGGTFGHSPVFEEEYLVRPVNTGVSRRWPLSVPESQLWAAIYDHAAPHIGPADRRDCAQVIRDRTTWSVTELVRGFTERTTRCSAQRRRLLVGRRRFACPPEEVEQ